MRESANLSSEGTQSKHFIQAVRAGGPHVVSAGTAELCCWKVTVVTGNTWRKECAERVVGRTRSGMSWAVLG